MPVGSGCRDEERVYSIALVVDPTFGRRVVDLARTTYVWLVRSNENDRWAQVVWDAPSDGKDPLMYGVTTFVRLRDENVEDMLLRLLDMIDEHHGEFAHDPEWSEIAVVGAGCSAEIERAALAFGVHKCEPTPDGFRMLRSS